MTSSPAIKLQDLPLEGNVIPVDWFRHIQYEDGRPDLHAIIILSDIVYWYRPLQIRDEGTGQVRGYGQSFKHPLLQKSYHCYENLLGLSKRQISNAFLRLEHLNLVRRIYEESLPSDSLPEVFFIEIQGDRIREISFPWLLERSSGLSSASSSQETVRPEGTSINAGEVPVSFREKGPHLKVIYPQDRTPLEKEVMGAAKRHQDSQEGVAQHMLDLWNQTFSCYAPASLTSFRRCALLKVYTTSFGEDLNQWQQFCQKIQHSDFLQGQGPRGWRASLDWCLEETNLRKIQEGQYDNRTSVQDQAPSSSECLLKAQGHIRTLSGDHQGLAMELCERLGPATYLSWFQSMTLLPEEGRMYKMNFPSRFMRDYVDVHYRVTLGQCLERLHGYTGPLTLGVQSPAVSKTKDHRSVQEGEGQRSAAPSSSQEVQTTESGPRSSSDPQSFSFEPRTSSGAGR